MTIRESFEIETLKTELQRANTVIAGLKSLLEEIKQLVEDGDVEDIYILLEDNHV